MRSLSHNLSPSGLAARFAIRFRWLTPPAFHVPSSGLGNFVDRKPNCASQMKRKTNFLAVQACPRRMRFGVLRLGLSTPFSSTSPARGG